MSIKRTIIPTFIQKIIILSFSYISLSIYFLLSFKQKEINILY